MEQELIFLKNQLLQATISPLEITGVEYPEYLIECHTPNCLCDICKPFSDTTQKIVKVNLYKKLEDNIKLLIFRTHIPIHASRSELFREIGAAAQLIILETEKYDAL